MVGDVQGLFQVRENMFPLDPTVILQGVSDDLVYFLNGLLYKPNRSFDAK